MRVMHCTYRDGQGDAARLKHRHAPAKIPAIRDANWWLASSLSDLLDEIGDEVLAARELFDSVAYLSPHSGGDKLASRLFTLGDVFELDGDVEY